MTGTFDVARDHAALLRDTAAVLSPDGVILFSTHVRRFKLDEEALASLGLSATDVTERMIPPDFERKRPHRTWEISAKRAPSPARGRAR
jgi:23S rRNA (guanine2445-N2)-methyltransferase / 23S rRNA (guanine2069-N7)-methyltransferase